MLLFKQSYINVVEQLDCEIEVEGAGMIMAGLNKNHTLTTLNLRCEERNGITNENN